MREYVGRFAPSPTGPLHFGSLVTAVASYLDARRAAGKWLVRMEDLDTPRCVPGAADQILRTLEHFGFEWDGPVMYQSTRTDAYREALRRLPVYVCTCSRKEAAGPVYPGKCRRAGRHAASGPFSMRLAVEEGAVIGFEDRHFGHYEQRLSDEVGDFVVLRADGLFAYQLAVVVDDAAQGVTDVVRGADLLDSTPRQIYLQRLLGYPQPRYMHIPIVTNTAGEKLSKQTLAPPLDWDSAPESLNNALRFLGWEVPKTASVREFWAAVNSSAFPR